MYKLDIDPKALQSRIRQEFEKNRSLTELDVINILIFKCRTEYEETMNFWKQKSHVMRYFENDLHAESQPRDFLGKFYQGLV